MGKTKLSIEGRLFKINGQLTYSEIKASKKSMQGLLMNSRHIQGIFDTQFKPDRFNRYGKMFNADKNTDDMIAALPQWYAKGLRAITVGMQGGGNCFSIGADELENNPYSADGMSVDKNYLNRLDRLIMACDNIGMVVIVSYFYSANLKHLNGAKAIINIVKVMGKYLSDKDYTNVIIEIANEQNIDDFSHFPIIFEPQGMVALIDIAKTYSGNIPVGCSGGGGYVNKEICEASDIVLIHGNGQSQSALYNLICRAMEYSPNKPIVINEDSQAIDQLKVCEELCVSWGYYNNMTKQEVPADWGITEGEDRFFAYRMAEMLGIEQEQIPQDDRYYLQGLEKQMHNDGIRYIRVASLYPSTIDYVRFYRNNVLFYVCYDECYTVNYKCNWLQTGVKTITGEEWRAEIVLINGEVINLSSTVEN